MKRMVGILSGTLTDKHGERMSREALESSAQQINANYVRLGWQHDPRVAPVGRWVRAWVEPSSDGEYVLKGEAEVFEPEDQVPDYVSSPRRLKTRDFPAERFQLVFSRSYLLRDDQELIAGISEALGTPARFENQKAVEPLSLIALGVTFALGAVAGGFFKALGADAYQKVKEGIKRLLKSSNTSGVERLLSVEVRVVEGNRSLNVHIVLTNPTEAEVDSFLSNGHSFVASEAHKYFASPTPIAEVCFAYRNGHLLALYALREDGFPLRPL